MKKRVNLVVVGFFCLIIGMIVTNPAMLYPEARGTFLINDTFVGINISTPMYELDVNGTVRANYFIGDGSQITGVIGGGGIWHNNSGTAYYYNDVEVANEIIGDQITFGRFLLSSYGGTIDAGGDPWYMSGTSLQLAENLTVDHNITSSEYFIGDGSLLTGIGGSGIWTNNSGTAYYYNDVEVENNLTVNGSIGVNTAPSEVLDISDGSNSRCVVDITGDANTKTSLCIYGDGNQKKTEFSVSRIWNVAKIYTLAGNFEFWVDGWKKATLSGNKLEFINSFPIEVEQVNAVDSDGLKLYDDDSNGIFIEDGGKVGIGTVSPSAMLDVEVASGGAATIGSAGCTATGDCSVATGFNTTASGDYSFATGRETTASADYTFASGVMTTASSAYSFVSGYRSVASAPYTFAGGSNCVASREGAFAVGDVCKACEDYAFAVGSQSIASGQYSFSSGSGCNASGTSSVCMGSVNNASGDYSFTGGYHMRPTSGAGTFVWGYSGVPQVFAPANNRFLIFPQGDTGRVGINITNPDTELHVNGTITTKSLDVIAGQGEDAVLKIWADEGDDSQDRWSIEANGAGLHFEDTYGSKYFSIGYNTAVVVNENGDNDVDFRVESDTDTHAFFVDATDGCVTIGNILHLTPLASAPGSPAEGDIYYNSVNHKAYCYDGTVWQGMW